MPEFENRSKTTGKSLTKNYIYNVSYQILTAITPLITTPYVSRKLGADVIGMYSFGLSIVTYYKLFAVFGTATYGQREISYAQDDRKRRTNAFWNVEFLSCISSFLCLVVYFVFVYFSDDKLLYIILAIDLIIVPFDITWLFQGMEEFGRIASRNIFVRILNIILVFLLIHSPDDKYIYVLIMCLPPLVGMIALWPFMFSLVDLPDLNDLHPFKDFKVVLSMFVPTIAVSLYTVFDKTMIGLLTGIKAENGYYEQADKIVKTVRFLVTSLGAVMIPRVGFFYEKGDMAMVRALMYRSYRFVWFLGIPLCFGLIGISNSFVPWFLGDGFEKDIVLLSILSFLIIAIGINHVTGIQYYIPTQRQNLFTITVLFGAGTNLIFNLLLIPIYYSIGAAIASVIAETVIAVVQIIITRNELSPKVIMCSSVPYIISGTVMLFVVMFISKHMEPLIINTVILIIIGSLLYFLVLSLFKDDFLKMINVYIKTKILKY